MTQEFQIKRLMEENSKLRAQLTELRSVAYRDLTTGLWNRRYFQERLDEEFRRMRRFPSCELSILIFDVNNLKIINDTYGHCAGDDALRWVASFLRDNLRNYDVCCRWGGDEFLAILPNTNPEGRRSLTRRLLADAQTANTTRDIPVSFAVGGATSIGYDQAVTELVAEADRDMYNHKQMTRNKGGFLIDMPRRLGESFRFEEIEPPRALY